VGLASISSWYTGNETLIQNILIAALLAFSVQVALRTGIFSLAGIGFYAIGSYTAALLVKKGWSTVEAMAAATALTIVVGYALAVLLVRLRDLYLAMATFAFDLMIGVIATNWNGVTGGALGVTEIPLAISTLAIFLTVVVAAGLLTLMERGVLGRATVAIREDEELAQSFAVDTRSYRRFAFVLSCVLGSFAGAYHALLFGVVEPTDAGFSLIVLALTMVIIGGFGSWFGALLGAFLLTWLPLRLTSLGSWWPVIYGALMMLIATWMPGGIIGVASNLIRRGRGGPRLRSPLPTRRDEAEPAREAA
jgi:branched-chain amino acid transport system permease protein